MKRFWILLLIPAMLYAFPATAATTILEENFETYVAGPDQSWGAWQKLFNAVYDPANNLVTRELPSTGRQSIQVYGSHTGSWSAVAAYPLPGPLPSAFYVQADIKNSGDVFTSAGNPHESAIGLVTDYYPSGAGPWIALVATPRWANGAITGMTGGIIADDIPFMSWYKVKMLVNLDYGTVDYWVNGTYRGRQTAPELTTYGPSFKYLALDAGGGRSWYDKILVYY